MTRLDGSLMTVEMTADLEWQENNNHHNKADTEDIATEKQ